MSQNQLISQTSADTSSAAKTDSSKSADVQPISAVYMGPPEHNRLINELYGRQANRARVLSPPALVGSRRTAPVSHYRAPPSAPMSRSTPTAPVKTAMPSRPTPPVKTTPVLPNGAPPPVSQQQLNNILGSLPAKQNSTVEGKAPSATTSGSAMSAPSYPGLFSSSSSINTGDSAVSVSSVDYSKTKS